MKILVTGANGLLGQKLVSLLQEKEDIELIATARGKSVQTITRGTFYMLDVTDKNQVDTLISATKPDVIIHTAAMTQVDDCETKRDACVLNNVTAVEHLIEACSKNGVHLVHVSTDFIFDGTHGPLDETAEPNPVNFYGESKLAAERLIQASNISWSILRTVLVYGVTNDMSRSNIVLWVKKSLEEGKTISVVNDQWRTPTLAEDLAQGCYLAAVKKATGVFNISGKDFVTPFDIATQTATFFGLDPSLIQPTDSTKFRQPARRPMKTGFIIDKAKKELGYEPHSFLEGLEILSKQLTR
ncbi:MAG: NAD(P)-dependent oxidoreductase [Cyclobacteriaceae bacterium]|nr:NAD(P)-dependent oxidoreductase [Cyclobacteriaceae bacterium]